jgi:DNA uptake protein ComE-like DNA-binding protein
MDSNNEESLGHTSRGLKWEYQQSWYMLSILTVWLYWVPLVYTGARVMDLRWIFWGFLYGIPVFVSWFLHPEKYGLELYVNRAIYVSLIFATIQAIRTRGEFLERLVAIEDDREELRQNTLHKKAMVEAQRRAEMGLPAFEMDEPEPVVSKRMLFDPDTMTERDFAMLPDMGPTLARQAVALREQLGGFKTFEHFAEKMALTPKTRSRLRPLFIEPPPPAEAENTEYRQQVDGSRVLDINIVSVDALATLPGINRDIARRAVQLREADGPFSSAEDFRFRLGLSMDQLVPLQAIISTLRTAVKRADPKIKPSGRIVDV